MTDTLQKEIKLRRQIKNPLITTETAKSFKRMYDMKETGLHYLLGLNIGGLNKSVDENGDANALLPQVSLLIRYLLENPQYVEKFMIPTGDLPYVFRQFVEKGLMSQRRLSTIMGKTSSVSRVYMRAKKPEQLYSTESVTSRLGRILELEVEEFGLIGAFRRLERVFETEVLSRGLDPDKVKQTGTWYHGRYKETHQSRKKKTAGRKGQALR